MITNIFSRSNPMNFAIIAILLLIPFVLTVQTHYTSELPLSGRIVFLSIYPILLFSSFLIDFMSKKNALNKNDDYTLLFFVLFLNLIPDVFKSFSVVVSNIFLLFALRRLLSIQSLIAPKQKIFDATFWIAIAAIFEFEALWFLILVFVSIIIHVSNDFKNWIIPFVSIFVVGILVLMYSFMFDYQVLENIIEDASRVSFSIENISEKLSYFSPIAFVSLVILLFVYQLSSIGNYLTYILNSVRKVIILLLLALFVYLISDRNDSSMLLYAVAPMSIISVNLINSVNKKPIRETFVLLLLVLGVIALYQN